ncbi:hypothetical protein [Thalassovita sp.]|uniref:hypothetical protein n=1 Tax=Thalassovita sp. TaxID=1979401 RepID=UPI0029DE8582|nr:hypothetical protein [Thalassovita sp.]
MIERFAGAVVRAFFVAMLVALPSVFLPGTLADSTALVLILTLVAAILTFLEYNSEFPSVVEFRYAPPFNRLRFGAVFVLVLILTIIARGKVQPSELSQGLTAIGRLLGNTIDFPYSPVRLVVLMMPVNAPKELISDVRIAAGLAYFSSLVMMFIFVVYVRFLGWPARNGAFNVWVNLPMFDPTMGDVLSRLYRDARVNIALGFVLPFLIPAVVKLMSTLIDPVSLAHPQTLVWTMTAWALLPASMIMRGFAIGRVADMIEEKRRRAYAEAEEQGLQTI